MSTEKVEIETFFGRCRCCLSYGYLKNMWTPHHFEGEAEIYGEMLVQCFALTWDYGLDTQDQDQICEQCICRLRDANDFKKVILESQAELFQQIDADLGIKEERLDEELLIEYKQDSEDTADTMYADTEYLMDDIDPAASVKDETEYEDVEYLEEEDTTAIDAVDTDSSQPTDKSQAAKRQKQPRQQYSEDEETPKRKWPKKLPKSERHKTYKQYSEVDLRKCLEEVRNNVLTAAEAAMKYDIPKKTICAKVKVDPNDVQIDNTTKSNNKKSLRKRATSEIEPTDVTETKKDRKSTEANLNVEERIYNVKEPINSDDQRFMYKHKANIKAILQYSNATLIKSYGRDGYSCNFCDFQADKPYKLKQHNLKIHTDVGDEAIKRKYVSDLNLKLDTTDFKCKLCDEPMNTLKEFTRHLSRVHSKLIYTDVKNYIIPFKFDSDDFRCCICGKNFKYFKLLSEHMTEHYRNFDCPVCDRSFINKQSMQTHSYRHNKGIFKCSYCLKEFDSRPKRVDHERAVHMAGTYRKCAHCNRRFPTWDAVIDHELTMHGVAKPKHTCEDCGNTYTKQSTLTMHKNRCHLFKKPHKCPYCEMSFCTKAELRYHVVTHTKTRNHSCKICKKMFGTPITLGQHMRTHTDVKKYLCDYCDRRFSHRTTFKRHMRNTHAEIV